MFLDRFVLHIYIYIFLYYKEIMKRVGNEVYDITNGQSRETGNTRHTRRRQEKQKHNTICVGHHYAQANTNNVNKT